MVTNVKKYIVIFFIILSSAIFLMNLDYLRSYINSGIYIAIALNLFLVLLAFWYYNFDFISLLLFCIELLIIPISIQYFTGHSYGMLELGWVPLYLYEALSYTYLFCVVLLTLAIVFNFKTSEINILQVNTIKLNNQNIFFNNVVAIVFTIVAFPRLSMNFNGAERFDMLLPGHAWNQLAITALLFNINFLRENRSVQLTYLFVISWFLLNGERVDITGLFFGLVIYYFLNNANKIKTIKVYFVIIIFVLILNIVFYLRNNQSFSLSSLVNNLFVSSTVSDIGYLLMVTIDCFKKFGNTMSNLLFISDIKSIVPFSSPYNFNSFIRSAGYATPGGEPFFAQPLLDWGFIGLIIRPFIDFSIFKFIASRKNSFFKMEFLIIISSVPRMVWYGRSYLFSSIFFFVPFMYFFNKIILNANKSKINEK